jgi:hypothetical protein
VTSEGYVPAKIVPKKVKAPCCVVSDTRPLRGCGAGNVPSSIRPKSLKDFIKDLPPLCFPLVGSTFVESAAQRAGPAILVVFISVLQRKDIWKSFILNYMSVYGKIMNELFIEKLFWLCPIAMDVQRHNIIYAMTSLQ